MKVFPLLAAVLLLTSCQNQVGDQESNQQEQVTGPALELIWETDDELETNESVLYDPSSKQLYVSCINGKPTERDTNGYIAIVDLEGDIQKKIWAEGFSAPKGMAIANGRLFVSDIDRIVSISLSNPADQYFVEVPNSRFLNDITPGLNGVYFSDMATGHLYYLENQIVHLLNENLPNLNGLAFFNQSLYALSNNGLQKLSVGGEVLETINAELSGGDGLIVINDNKFIVSRWKGEVWLLKGAEATLVLDSKEEEIQTADIGYDPLSKTLYVPRFFANKVSAYQVKGF